MEPVTLADARWDCRGCSECCRSYLLGPVEPDLVGRLSALGMDVEKPGWYRIRPGPEGPAYFLEKKDGACVFLLPDRRCELHARFGMDHKPGFCREYPFHVIRDAGDPIVTVRASCTGLHETWLSGTPVADRAADVLGTPRVVPVGNTASATVALLPGVGVGVESWRKLVPVLLRRLAGVEGNPGDLAADVRDAVVALTGRALPSPDPARADVAARMVVERLEHLVRTAARAGEGEEWQRRFFADAADLLHAALVRERPAGWDAETARYLRMVYRSQLLSRNVLSVGGLPEGTGLWLLGAWVCRRDAPTTALHDLGPRHALWTRLLENRQVVAFLRTAGPPLVQLFVHADASCP